MNGLGTRSALVQAAERAHNDKPRPIDFSKIVMAERNPQRRRRADQIIGAIGVAGTIVIVLWLLIEQLVRHTGLAA